MFTPCSPHVLPSIVPATTTFPQTMTPIYIEMNAVASDWFATFSRPFFLSSALSTPSSNKAFRSCKFFTSPDLGHGPRQLLPFFLLCILSRHGFPHVNATYRAMAKPLSPSKRWIQPQHWHRQRSPFWSRPPPRSPWIYEHHLHFCQNGIPAHGFLFFMKTI